MGCVQSAYKSIYKFGLSVCLFVCLSVCLYPINVKTAEPIRSKFFVGHLGTPGKVYEKSKFQIFVSIKIRSFFKNFENPRNFLWKSANYFYFVHKENMFTINLGDWREAPSNARKKGAKRLEFLGINTRVGLLESNFPSHSLKELTQLQGITPQGFWNLLPSEAPAIIPCR